MRSVGSILSCSLLAFLVGSSLHASAILDGSASSMDSGDFSGGGMSDFSGGGMGDFSGGGMSDFSGGGMGDFSGGGMGDFSGGGMGDSLGGGWADPGSLGSSGGEFDNFGSFDTGAWGTPETDYGNWDTGSASLGGDPWADSLGTDLGGDTNLVSMDSMNAGAAWDPGSLAANDFTLDSSSWDAGSGWGGTFSDLGSSAAAIDAVPLGDGATDGLGDSQVMDGTLGTMDPGTGSFGGAFDAFGSSLSESTDEAGASAPGFGSSEAGASAVNEGLWGQDTSGEVAGTFPGSGDGEAASGTVGSEAPASEGGTSNDNGELERIRGNVDALFPGLIPEGADLATIQEKLGPERLQGLFGNLEGAETWARGEDGVYRAGIKLPASKIPRGSLLSGAGELAGDLTEVAEGAGRGEKLGQATDAIKQVGDFFSSTIPDQDLIAITNIDTNRLTSGEARPVEAIGNYIGIGNNLGSGEQDWKPRPGRTRIHMSGEAFTQAVNGLADRAGVKDPKSESTWDPGSGATISTTTRIGTITTDGANQGIRVPVSVGVVGSKERPILRRLPDRQLSTSVSTSVLVQPTKSSPESGVLDLAASGQVYKGPNYTNFILGSRIVSNIVDRKFPGALGEAMDKIEGQVASQDQLVLAGQPDFGVRGGCGTSIYGNIPVDLTATWERIAGENLPGRFDNFQVNPDGSVYIDFVHTPVDLQQLRSP